MKNKSIRMIPVFAVLAVMIPLLCSAGARRTVAPQYVIGPKDTACVAGGKARLAVSAPSTRPEYQWQVSADGGETWRDVSGSNAASVTLDAVEEKDDGALYRVTVKNGAGSVTSSAARLTVTKATPPTIRTQPADQTVENGKTATFTISAKGGGLSYQWQYSEDAGATWKDSAMEGSKSASLPVKGIEARNGLFYRVRVKNSAGSVVSNAVMLTVSGVKPAIRIQPASAEVASGETAEFAVKAAGTGISYQWQYSSDGGKTWKDSKMEGSKSDVLPVKGIPVRNGFLYRCVVTNSFGSVASQEVKLTVK